MDHKENLISQDRIAEADEEAEKEYQKYLEETDPIALIQLTERYRVNINGTVSLDEPFLSYYRKRLAHAGMVLENHLSSERDFLTTLQTVNLIEWEKLEAEAHQEKDPIMRKAILAIFSKDFDTADRYLQIAKRRKGLKVITNESV